MTILTLSRESIDAVIKRYAAFLDRHENRLLSQYVLRYTKEQTTVYFDHGGGVFLI